MSFSPSYRRASQPCVIIVLILLYIIGKHFKRVAGSIQDFNIFKPSLYKAYDLMVYILILERRRFGGLLREEITNRKYWLVSNST